MRFLQSGFSLIRLLIVIAMLGMLAAAAYPAYQSYIKNADLRAAQAALVQNAQFMERFYQQKGSFKQTSTKWPELPNTSTDKFCIRPNNNAKGAHDSKFTLKAVAFNSRYEPRILKIDESLTIFICERSTSLCDTDDAFFKGEDKDCTIYQP
ncbi:type IV pilin protein [Neisseria iguanae]|uniref:Pilin n=1 Tax=Neisseria iguanae TaxID=90242 RepID=A0A2P7U2J6_9NEIS|nr:type IV pilin protein [Neisseria iguanae]PSJ81165.1 pilin [Neisseria iguanae]